MDDPFETDEDFIPFEQDGYVIIGNKQIDGFIDWRLCDKCGRNWIYNATFDAYFCARCNVWLERDCGHPDCGFCNRRPAQPL